MMSAGVIVRWRDGVLLRAAGALFLFLALVNPLATPQAVRAAQADVLSLDLAAVALTIWDLEDAGIDYPTVGTSETFFLDRFAVSFAERNERDADQVRAVLDEAGFTRAHSTTYYAGQVADYRPDRVVDASIVEFTEADSAEDAWEFLQDESEHADAEDLEELDDRFGDRSEGTRSTGVDAEDGAEYIRLDLTAQVGNLHVGIAITDWVGDEPEPEVAATLMGFLLERLEATIEAGEPGLSDQVARFSADSIDPTLDLYLVRDGEAVRLFGDQPRAADDRLDLADTLGFTEHYRFWARLAAPSGDAWYFLTLAQFKDEDAAADWMDNHQDAIASDANFAEATFDDAPDFGDGAFGYTVVTLDGVYTYRGLVFQTGVFVATLEVAAIVMPPLDVVEALADVQLGCMEAGGGCAGAFELPAVAGAFIADIVDAESDQEPPENREFGH